MKRAIANKQVDPTFPKSPIEINGTMFSLCFDLGALAEAEAAINEEGHKANLLTALPIINLGNVRLIFAAAIRKFHPEITYERAIAMVNLGNIYSIANCIQLAWTEALPEAVPTEAVAE